jgi:GTP-binding protein
MFIDRVRITIKAGDGGNGCISFFPNSGGPSGGHGGIGGSILFQGDSNLTSLAKLRWKRMWKAENGKNGSSNQKNGHKGKDIVIKLPLGTEIHYDGQVSLIETEEEYIFQNGGKGGLGNSSFVSSTTRAPKISTEGEKIFPIEIEIIFKLTSDIGIVGMPNSGKSSFLNRVTSAKSKVADYAFSTLHPYLGAKDGWVFVDVPGLIKGASENKGLGHKFLSHVEKCKVLLVLVDITTNPIESLEVMQNELSIYGLKQPQILCFNKCDQMKKKEQKELRKKYPNAFFISVHKGSLDRLVKVLKQTCERQKILKEDVNNSS